MPRIAVQIGLSYLALTALTVGIGVVAATLLVDLGGAVQQTLDENVQSVVAAERMGRALDAQEAARRAGDTAAIAAGAAGFAAALAEARGAAVLPEEPALLDALSTTHAAYTSDVQAGRGADAARRAAATDALRRRLLALNERAAQERSARASAAGYAARRFLMVAVVCAVLASVLAGGVFARRISRPLQDLTAKVAEVGRGTVEPRADERASGEVGALAHAFNEMTERLGAYRALNLRALLRETRTAESLVAAIPSPVLVTEGAEARVRLANAAASRLLGGDAVGRPLGEAAPALARAAAGGGPDPLVDLGAEARTYRLRQSRLDAPDAEGVHGKPGEEPDGEPAADDRLDVLLLDDVTPFRALDAARRDFLATVSHELRTPITSMHLAAGLLLRGAAGPLTDAQRELAEMVAGDVQRMKTLTARLLDLARVEVGGGPTAPVDLAAAASAAVDGVRMQAAARGVDVTAEGAATLDGDADGLAMALSNLVGNAVRHAATRVTVRVGSAAGTVRLTVTDDGPGLPPGTEDRVFEPLVQLDATEGAPPPGSAGLGLAIVRRVAEAHGGRAWAEPGPGGRFVVEIPAAAPSRDAPAGDAPAGDTPAGDAPSPP